LNESGKTVVATARRDLGLERQTVLGGKWQPKDLGRHDNSLGFSVIIPCKDVEPKLVERALASVVDQTPPKDMNYEVILVDDQSDPAVHESLPPAYRGNPRIRIIRNSQNKGLGLARNIGLEMARGACIFFLDADDYYAPDFVRSLCGALERYDVVFSQMVIHREDENVYEWENYVNTAVAELMKRNGDQGKVITATSACVKAYRREVIESGRLFFGVGYHEDVFPWVRFTVENPSLRIGATRSAVYYRTIRKGSAQITENPALAIQRTADLKTARQAVVQLLHDHNQAGRFTSLISQYQGLLAPGTPKVSSNGAK
jgi:hypothetical protein